MAPADPGSEDPGEAPGGSSDGCVACLAPTGAPSAALEPGPRRALHRIVAAHDYAGLPRDLVLALKYASRPVAAELLGRDLAAALRDAGTPGDLLVPVPLAAGRRRTRGFNQASLLAREVGRHLDLPVEAQALRRIEETPPLAAASRVGRTRLVRGAFVAHPRRIRGRCVLLIDDVLTTGSTAAACARTLRRGGALAVTAAVCCRGR